MESRDNLSRLSFLIASLPYFWDSLSLDHWTGMMVWLGWTDSQHLRLSCLPFFNTGITDSCHCICVLYEWWGFKLRSTCLWDRDLDHWVILSEDLNNFSVDDEVYWICLIQRVFLLNSLSSFYPAYSVLKLKSCMLLFKKKKSLTTTITKPWEVPSPGLFRDIYKVKILFSYENLLAHSWEFL